MTDKQTYWVANLAGEKAFVTGAEERDRWSLHGWSETTEPGDDDGGFVWMSHETLPDQPGLIAWGAREYWQGTGWVPSAPPVPVNPTKDPVLTDVKLVEKPPTTKAQKVEQKSEKDS